MVNSGKMASRKPASERVACGTRTMCPTRAALLNLLAIAVGVLCTSTASPEVAGQAADVDRVIGHIDGVQPDGEHVTLGFLFESVSWSY